MIRSDGGIGKPIRKFFEPKLTGFHDRADAPRAQPIGPDFAARDGSLRLPESTLT